jgi:hypothetical protein
MSNGERFDFDVQVKLPLIEPARTKAGTIRIHQPRIPKRSTTWWSAQCIFRGLPASRNVEDKRERIRGALANPMSNVMVRVLKDWRLRCMLSSWSRMLKREIKNGSPNIDTPRFGKIPNAFYENL